MTRATISYLGFGSNLGRKKLQIERALEELAKVPGVSLKRTSSLYRTQPVGGPSQSDHFNGVAEISVRLSPKKLLRELKRIERKLGRRKSPKWGPRIIDLDLLTYGRKVINQPYLKIPHALYHLRRFVLVPFCEINPHFLHPVKRVPNRTLLRRLTLHGQRVTMHARWKKDRFYRSKKRKKTTNPLSL